jgi:hypothetical protein
MLWSLYCAITTHKGINRASVDFMQCYGPMRLVKAAEMDVRKTTQHLQRVEILIYGLIHFTSFHQSVEVALHYDSIMSYYSS